MRIDGSLPKEFFSNPQTAKIRVNLKRLQAMMMHYGETVLIQGTTYSLATKKLCPGVFELWLTRFG